MIMAILKIAFSLLVIFLAIVSLLSIWKNQNKAPVVKIAWTLGVLLFPLVGSLAWLLIGRS
ncbi:MAG: hypothetical protein D6730_04135 [Bacteroidetes bacterium]|nr:MAG: hypothetical protein D6730_04135 [Bacteroidota bacterium]